MQKGIKHLIQCQCVLSQFKAEPNPPLHQFIVFSVLDDSVFQVKFAQCNNCGALHKVTDVCKSEIIKGREDSSSVLGIDDIKLSLPEQLVGILEKHEADLPLWEQAKWIFETQSWGEFVVLSNEIFEGVRQTKVVRILGSNLFQMNTHTSDVYI
jgi:hypothetical protein